MLVGEDNPSKDSSTFRALSLIRSLSICRLSKRFEKYHCTYSKEYMQSKQLICARPHRPAPARRRLRRRHRDRHPARRRARRRRHAGRADRCRRLADRRAVGAAARGRPPRRRAGRARRRHAPARPPPALGGAGPDRPRPVTQPAPEAVAGVGQVTLTWPEDPDAVGYVVHHGDTPDTLAPLDHGGGDLLVVPCLPYADTRREAGRLVRRRRRADGRRRPG